MSIANNIRQLRKQKHLTQKQLAEKSGLAVITIQQYEAGKFNPKPNTVMKLCVGLDCKITDIIDDETQKYYRMFDDIKEDTPKFTKSDSNSNVHNYDGSIRVNTDTERERLDEEAQKIIIKQESGEEITPKEAQKVSDYIERTREDYDKLSKSIKNCSKIIGRYLNENTQMPEEIVQILKENLQKLTDMTPTTPDFYENLNDIGRQKAAEQIDLLTKIPEYQKHPPQE